MVPTMAWGIFQIKHDDLPIWSGLLAFVAVGCASPLMLRFLASKGRVWRGRFETEIRAGLVESFVFIDSRYLFHLQCALVLVLGAVSAWWFGSIWVTLIFALVARWLPVAALRRIKQSRRSRFALQFPDALMLMCAGLRAGSSPIVAFSEVSQRLPAPLSEEFSLVLRELKFGLRLEAALSRLEQRMPLQDVRLFSSAVKIAQETGGNLAETLQLLAESARARSNLEGKLQVLTAQGRMQAWVMVALPVLVLIGMRAVDPEGAQLLLGTSQGWWVLAGVVLLQVLGLFMIRRILALAF